MMTQLWVTVHAVGSVVALVAFVVYAVRIKRGERR